MKAAAITSHGGLDRLTIVDLPEPVPGPGQVRLRVHAAALNHLDLWVRRGLPGLTLPMPHVIASDVAAVVESWGEGVNSFKTGQAVVVSPGFGCGGCAACLGGDESLCRSYHIYGESVPGLMAAQVVVPALHVLPMPGGLTFGEAAALPLTFMTAWRMVMNRGGLRPADTVLVLAAASGVGTAALQIARVAGARVIAGASSEPKRALARSLGADEVVDTSTTDWRKQVKAVTGRRGVDLVVEHVGGRTFEAAMACLAPGGRLVTCGATTGAEAQLNLRHVFFKQLSVVGSTMGTRADLTRALDLVGQGRLRPVVHGVFPLAQIQQAQQVLEDRQALGKVVLDVSGQASERPSS
ncbi:MAG: zinc-binding dehydrogenase [Pseudomonadota bacterium]